MICPTCRTGLVEHVHEGMRMDACPQCRGQFVAHTALATVLRDQDVPRPDEEQQAAREAASLRHSGNADPSAARACPVCNITLRRYVFGLASGVVVDGCAEHGVWLDAGELEQLEAWAEATNFGMGESAARDVPVPPPAGGAPAADTATAATLPLFAARAAAEDDRIPTLADGAIVCGSQIDLPLAPRDVWAFVARVERYPEWMANVASAAITSDVGMAREQELVRADGTRVRQRILGLLPERTIRWRDLDAPSWTSIDLQAQPDGTTRLVYTVTVQPAASGERTSLTMQQQTWIDTSLGQLGALSVAQPTG